MATLLSVGIKQQDGSYKNYTIGVNDDTNEYGKNVSIWEEQTKEQREAKDKKNFCGNGRVIWTNGTVTKAEFKEQTTNSKAIETASDDLPF